MRFLKFFFIISLMLTVFVFSCSKEKQDKPDTETPLPGSGRNISYFKNNSTIQRQMDIHLSRMENGDAYQLMAIRDFLGAMNSLIQDSNDEYFIGKQIQMINSIIASSKYSYELNKNYSDQYKGWITLLVGNDAYHKEVPLYESYSFFYITKFLYYLKQSKWIDKSTENKEWWNSVVLFTEKNIWEKWKSRSEAQYGNDYGFFLRSRVHMGSHWAGIARFLELISDNTEIQEECEALYTDYDMLLKRNLKPNSSFPEAYIWNQTYDDVSETDAIHDSPAIQDGSHGNHVVSYIVESYELGNNVWKKDDLLALCNTLKKVIYNKETHRFSDFVDGTSGGDRPGWGNNVADGWLKLSRYDKDVSQIFQDFSSQLTAVSQYQQLLPYNANLFFYGFKN